MDSNQQQQEMDEKQQQIPTSFSSPEFETTMTSSSTAETVTKQHEMSSGSTSTSTTTTTTATSKMTKSKTSTNGIKQTSGALSVNTTRDSGFGDSLAEDSTTSSSISASNLIARTEHSINISNATSGKETTDITLHTKCFTPEKSKLKSVEESVDIIHPSDMSSANLDPDGNKEFITIVKTTKLTTKVKQVKPAAAAATTTSTTNSKNKKKNKKNKQRKSIENAEAALAETQQVAAEAAETTTAPVTTDSISSSQPVSTTNAVEMDHSDEDRTSNLTKEETEPFDDELNVDDDEVNKEHESSTLIKVDINKSTEELVFQREVVVTKLLNESTTISTTQNELMITDLNSTALDSEDILSTASQAQHEVPQSTNEIVNVVDVLSDVTYSLLNSNKLTETAPQTDDAIVPEQMPVIASTAQTSSSQPQQQQQQPPIGIDPQPLSTIVDDKTKTASNSEKPASKEKKKKRFKFFRRRSSSSSAKNEQRTDLGN